MTDAILLSIGIIFAALSAGQAIAPHIPKRPRRSRESEPYLEPVDGEDSSRVGILCIDGSVRI